MLTQHIIRTPLLPYFEKEIAGNIFLKPENLQIFGSYKIRGISSALAAAPKQRLQQGLVTISAGNMAQAVAFAANTLNIPCKVFVPDSAPEIKKMAIRKLGAKLHELPFAEIWEMVKCNEPERHNGVLIHPIFTPGILEGYGSIAYELVEDLAAVDAVVIPFGIGGLSLGIAKALQSLKPGVAIYAAESSGAAPLLAALQAGQVTKVAREPSFIDAIGTPHVLPQVFEQVKDLVCESVSITPPEAMAALKILLLRNKLLVEGAAAVSFAAALKISERKVHRNIVCILSGGNLPPEILGEVIGFPAES